MSGTAIADREAKLALARRMRASGATASFIAGRLGVSVSTAQRWMNPGAEERNREYMREYQRAKGKGPARPEPRESARMRRLAERSARVRSRRAEIKALIVVGELDVREVILDPPVLLRTTRIAEILACAPWIGEQRARAILRAAKVDERAVFGWTHPVRLAQIATAIPAHKPVRGKRKVRERVAA